MNEDHIAPMTPLDQMLAQDSLQMLKAAVPYFPADVQRVFVCKNDGTFPYNCNVFRRSCRTDDDVRRVRSFAATGYSAAASNVCR